MVIFTLDAIHQFWIQFFFITGIEPGRSEFGGRSQALPKCASGAYDSGMESLVHDFQDSPMPQTFNFASESLMII